MGHGARSAYGEAMHLPALPPRGVSLVELMIVVAVAAIVAAFAVPAYTSAREATRSGAAVQRLAGSIAMAASRAAGSGHEVVLCPGRPTVCVPTTEWHEGWIVYADVDRDRIHDPLEPVLERIAPLGGQVRLRSTLGRLRLVFRPDGASTGSNTTFTLCDGRGAAHARALVLNNTGQLRESAAGAAAAAECVRAQ